MKIVVIGLGLIGSQVVRKLTAAGHEVVPAAPSTGVDLITGKGLAEALNGAEVVVNLANSPTFDEASLDFFRTSMSNLLAAGQKAGVACGRSFRSSAWIRCPSSSTTEPRLCRRSCSARGRRRTPSCASRSSSNS